MTTSGSAPRRELAGIGSMVVDRVHRPMRLLGHDEKGMLQDVEGAGPVREYVGGVVLNHIGWAAALGLRTGIFGLQGDDVGGRFLRAAMDRIGIEHQIVLVDAATSLAEIFVDDEGQRCIYMDRGATALTTSAHVREHHADFIRSSSTLSTEVSQLPLAATRAALEIANEAGVTTVLDLDVPPSDALPVLGDREDLEAVLRSARVLKPAKGAARELISGESDTLVLARGLRERFGNEAVLVTDGEAGCAVSAPGFDGRVSAKPLRALDTTGAGDAFLGGLLVARHHGLDWPTAAAFANAAGAACCEQLGAFPTDPARARSRVQELYSGPPIRLAEIAGVAAETSEEPGTSAGLAALEVGAREIADLAARHDGGALLRAAHCVETCDEAGGRVHVTGIGKPAHVAHYAASLLASTGVAAVFLDATEALHGSLGQVRSGDVVIAISDSGATAELLETVRALRDRGQAVVAITGRADSPLAGLADVVLDSAVADEGGPLGLAPRASVAAQVLVVGALAAVLQDRSGFSRSDYAERHPAGSLGARAREE